MAIRRLNFTGRKRINREHVRIALHEKAGEPATFDADLGDLKEYKLPAEAFVFVEARIQTRWMRFAFGTVGRPSKNLAPTAALAEFDSTDGVLFSIKVTSASDRSGMMLAEADRIPVRFPGEVEEPRLPLLPVKSEELGHEIYRIDFTGPTPMLLINRAAGVKDTLVRSPLFMSLVYPAALREILNRIIHVEQCEEYDEEGDGWMDRWLKFATRLPNIGPVPDKDDDDRELWIDDAIAAFAKQQTMLDRFVTSLAEGGV